MPATRSRDRAAVTHVAAQTIRDTGTRSEMHLNGHMLDSELTLHSILWRTERVYASKEIVTRVGPGTYHRYTYADFGRRVRRLGDALQKLGVTPGARVATMAWNHYRHLETFFAIPGLQASVHTVNLRLSRLHQAFTINKAKDSMILVDPDQLAPLHELFRLGLDSVRAVIVMTDGPLPGHDLPVPVYSYEELLDDADEHREFEEFDERSESAVCFTSATTGDPKGVVYSHRAMVLQAMCMVMHDKVGMSEDQVWLEVAPMFHCNGWNIPHAAMMAGATLVLTGVHPAPADYLDMIEDLSVTGLNAAVTVGTMIRDACLAATVAGRRPALESVRTMWLGGQAPSEAIMRWFEQEYSINVVQGWGMTENSPQIAFFAPKSTLADLPKEELTRLRLTQGLPFPLVKIKVVGKDGDELAWDGHSHGEFHVRSPFTASEYLDDERTDQSMVDGWFRTGDIGFIDPEGYVHLKDRSKDLIKSGGEWISTIELENALMLHPKVSEAAVVAVDSDRWLERPLACVVPSDPTVTDNELREHLLANGFIKFWVPDTFLFVEAFPKTGVGKYDKVMIRTTISDLGPEGARSAFGPSLVTQDVR